MNPSWVLIARIIGEIDQLDNLTRTATLQVLAAILAPTYAQAGTVLSAQAHAESVQRYRDYLKSRG